MLKPYKKESYDNSQIFGKPYNKESFNILGGRTKRKKCDFWIQGTSKRVNPSKSPFRKFDPKTILSLLISKRK